jgi:hypothetical protein
MGNFEGARSGRLAVTNKAASAVGRRTAASIAARSCGADDNKGVDQPGHTSWEPACATPPWAGVGGLVDAAVGSGNEAGAAPGLTCNVWHKATDDAIRPAWEMLLLPHRQRGLPTLASVLVRWQPKPRLESMGSQVVAVPGAAVASDGVGRIAVLIEHHRQMFAAKAQPDR